MEAGNVFQTPVALAAHRAQLTQALREAFPGLVFNAGEAPCLPTTLNFAVRGVGSKLLLDLFDAAGLRVSAGSACSAAKAEPSYVLQAMGLEKWRTEAAVRLSFGALDSAEFIAAACARLRRCGEVLRARGLGSVAPATACDQPSPLPGHEAQGVFAAACKEALLPVGDAEKRALAIDCEAAVELHRQGQVLWVDVREGYERDVQAQTGLLKDAQAAPLSGLASALPEWLALAPQVPVVFYCRSGNRSAQAARALRCLGHASAWSLAGGLAMWSEPEPQRTAEAAAH
ncbi:aminotransferase class V-fold PLP-dependent enzyme [Comamonas endophytica]